MYTVSAGSEQLVLLRYTEATGWQIADVLQCPNGSPYGLASGNRPLHGLSVSGQMAPSGEAWLVLTQTVPSGTMECGSPVSSGPVSAVFHRTRGGAFVYDAQETTTLASVLSGGTSLESSPPTLALGEDPSGAVYGLLVSPQQQPVDTVVNSSGGPGVLIHEALSYGVLDSQTDMWSAKAAPLPPAYTPAPGDTVKLAAASESGPGSGWATLSVAAAGTERPRGRSPSPLSRPRARPRAGVSCPPPASTRSI